MAQEIRQKLVSFVKRFAHDESGSAVEYAFVGAPFLALIFAVMELGMLLLAQTTLDNATQSAARKIRTGEMQLSGTTAGGFKTALCAQMTWLQSSCAASVAVDVRSFTSFSSVTTPSPVVSGAVDPSATTYSPGNSGSVVLVRAFYTWTLITPSFNTGLENLSGGKRMITAAVAFRNEPF